MTETPSSPTPFTGATPVPQRHPRGLATLFFTEMWERFSFYGMRGLLVLYMTHEIQKGGLGGMGLTDKMAAAVYGLYTASVYLLCLPGGWLADRILGCRNAVWYGGIVIALGHFTMAIPRDDTFFLGLFTVAVGTGLLKPNISAIVGDLYPEGGARRDAGFSIYYMGINLGAFLAPFVCGTLGEKMNWHYGFAAAGVGMVLGLIQFRVTGKYLGNSGLLSPNHKPIGSFGKSMLMGVLGVVALFVVLSFTGIVKFKDPAALSTRDVVNFPAFKAKLDQPSDPVSQFLAGEMKQEALSDTNLIHHASIPVELNTVRQINIILNTNTLYDPQRFAAINLPVELKNQIQLLKGETNVYEQSKVNRRLIEAAYPGLIASNGINLITVAHGTALLILGVAVVYFIYVLFFVPLERDEKKRVGVIIVLFITSALFWAGFEQAGSSFNLFAERYTDRSLAWLNFILPASMKDYVFPASLFQSVGPIFVILLAPVMGGLWVQLGRRNLDPSIPIKFGLGLILLAAGFAVMALAAAALVAKGHSVSATWLTMTYLLHTFGELCLSPVGLSSVTKLAPRRLVGQMMGIWFLATSLGNLIAGLFAGMLEAKDAAQMPSRFALMVILPIAAGLLVMILAGPIKKLMAGVK